jgi:hypothetical protein
MIFNVFSSQNCLNIKNKNIKQIMLDLIYISRQGRTGLDHRSAIADWAQDFMFNVHILKFYMVLLFN